MGRKTYMNVKIKNKHPSYLGITIDKSSENSEIKLTDLEGL